MSRRRLVLRSPSRPAPPDAPARHGLCRQRGLKAAIAGRPDARRGVARDGARHPYETLTFWGLKPRQTVVEICPAAASGPRSSAPTPRPPAGPMWPPSADLANPNSRTGRRRAGPTSRPSSPTGQVREDQLVNFGPVPGRWARRLGRHGASPPATSTTGCGRRAWPTRLRGLLRGAEARRRPGGRGAPRRSEAGGRRRRATAMSPTATVIAAAAEGRLQARRPSPRSTPIRRTPRTIRSASGPCRPRRRQRRGRPAGRSGLRPRQVRRHRRERPHDPALPQAGLRAGPATGLNTGWLGSSPGRVRSG